MAKKENWFTRAARALSETYWKRIMTFIVYNAIGWVWCSYILAWFGREQIADDLSKTALSVILGVVVSYACKSTAENISKNGFVGKRNNVYLDTRPDSWTDIPEYDSTYTRTDRYEEIIDLPEDSEPSGGNVK